MGGGAMTDSPCLWSVEPLPCSHGRMLIVCMLAWAQVWSFGWNERGTGSRSSIVLYTRVWYRDISIIGDVELRGMQRSGPTSPRAVTMGLVRGPTGKPIIPLPGRTCLSSGLFILDFGCP